MDKNLKHKSNRVNSLFQIGNSSLVVSFYADEAIRGI